METVNGCTVIGPSDGAEPTRFGPTEAEGAYLAMVGMFPPGEPGPPPHIHPNTDEAFYLASGEATFLLGDREVQMRSGSLVLVPKGVVHTVWNSGTDPVHGLISSHQATANTSSSRPRPSSTPVSAEARAQQSAPPPGIRRGPLASRYTGPEHVKCNRARGQRGLRSTCWRRDD
jgi:mannose-6-phosphate isomerase-like protein (cupin superfamily)